jgi:hypothetical protein
VFEVIEATEVVEAAEVPDALWNHTVGKVQAVFDFFEAKVAVEVIEASDVIMSSDEDIEATEVVRTI